MRIFSVRKKKTKFENCHLKYSISTLMSLRIFDYKGTQVFQNDFKTVETFKLNFLDKSLSVKFRRCLVFDLTNKLDCPSFLSNLLYAV